MTPLHPLLLLLLIAAATTATAQQNTTGNGSSSSSGQSSDGFNTKFNPLTAVIVVVLIGVFFFATFIYIYFRKYSSTTTSQQSSRAPAGRSRTKVAAKGLDPAIIATFPTLVYSDVKGLKMGKSALECAVCLCEFHDEEELMLLPSCNHAFHVDCIGMWLSAHNTCPVCRANLDPPPAPAASDTAGEIVEEEQAPAEHVAVTVEEEPAPAPIEMGRSGSKRGKVFAKWRSRSARPELGARMGQYWAEEERERFTLRLPETVKADLMAGKLTRSRSVTAFPVGFGKGEGSSRSRKGYFGGLDGSAGRSYRMGRWDRAAKSDKWGFLLRSGSSRKGGAAGGGGGDREGSSKSGKWGFLMRSGSSRKGGVAAAGGGAAAAAAAGGGGEEDSVKADRWAFLRSGSSRKGGGGGGEEGSSRGKVLVAMKGPLEQCLGGGGGGKGADGKDDDELSTVALNRV